MVSAVLNSETEREQSDALRELARRWSESRRAKPLDGISSTDVARLVSIVAAVGAPVEVLVGIASVGHDRFEAWIRAGVAGRVEVLSIEVALRVLREFVAEQDRGDIERLLTSVDAGVREEAAWAAFALGNGRAELLVPALEAERAGENDLESCIALIRAVGRSALVPKGLLEQWFLDERVEVRHAVASAAVDAGTGDAFLERLIADDMVEHRHFAAMQLLRGRWDGGAVDLYAVMSDTRNTQRVDPRYPTVAEILRLALDRSWT